MTLPPDTTPPAEPTGPAGGSRPESGIHLRTVVTLAIGATLLLSLAVNLLVYVQMRTAQAQQANARAVARSLADQYQAKEPNMRQFVAALITYSTTHPDFQPILSRYRTGLAPFFADAGVLRPPAASAVPRPLTSPPAAGR